MAIDRIAPILRGRTDEAIPANFVEEAEALNLSLNAADFYANMETIEKKSDSIHRVYRDVYAARHNARKQTLETAIDRVKGHSEWPKLEELDKASADALLSPLTSRQCSLEPDLSSDAMECQNCGATLRELEADIANAPRIAAGILAELDQRAAPLPVETPFVDGGFGDTRVELASFFPATLESEEGLEQALEALRAYILERLRDGKPVTFA
jgi:hypothetical protein